MMGGDRSDPRPMLAIFAAAVLIAIWRLISSIHPAELLAWVLSLAPLALGAVAIAAALATHRLLATRRTLRSRQGVAIVPADEFDAEPDAVLRFAAQLAAGERRVAGWIDRRASAVRIRLAGDAERRLVYVIEVPERALEALRIALRSFEGVEERPEAEVLGAGDAAGEEADGQGGEGDRPAGEGAEPAVLRTELVLAAPSVEPLARLAPTPDPLQPFAAAIGRLRSAGADASVCLDLLPASGFRAARLRRRLRREARRIHGERRDWAALLNGEERRRHRPDPQEQVERRGAVQAVDAKLRESGELFEAQILLRCEAPTRGQAKVAMSSLLAAFRPLSDRNYLRASGLPIPGLAFLGSDIPLRRGSFERRFATGLFRPARKTILTARELAGFLKPPTVHCGERNVLRSGALLSPPPELPVFEKGQGDLLPLGRVATESGEQIVGVQTADTFFTYIAGRSRYGKTEAAIAQFAHIVRTGHGGLFLDPHGDGLERVEPYLADIAPERVVRINLAPGACAEQPGWNLFELGGSAEESEARVEAIVDAFASALEWGERSTRAINLTTQAAAALASIAGHLDPELAPTIFQIPTLLSDARWREAALPFLPRADQRFWADRFPLLASEAITPVTNMVDRLRRSERVRVLLGQSQSTYRVREAMDERKIVLACPGSGGTRDRLIANLLLFDLLHAARGRADLPPAERKPFWVFLDEVQSYDGAASGNLAALLEQSAKFGLRAVLLNQNPERLSAATLNALTTNRSHLLASTLNSHAAGLVTKEWGGRVSPEALTKLERFRFIAQVTHEGRLSAPFALSGVQVEDVVEKPLETSGGGGEGQVAASARSTIAVTEHLETLDDRIQAELERRRGEGEADAQSASGPQPSARAPQEGGEDDG
jgi:hypothetical protein